MQITGHNLRLDNTNCNPWYFHSFSSFYKNL